ncbi:hypothetical protein I4970_06675 [Pseudomonas aeruginosa]|uniref:hypothetical protein n=1 Tax=Pseudomonas aeruginosa TaxID=287 RepID=UPI000B91969F|nr:hypothetical protein [Pseudomonas aeruginosa]EIU7092100.1 hypothetical protein [Pseudomonas aeruginosa]MBG5265836.1 hypothetical protein [Pseudomonas aeruginosa]MBR7579496.1 hypothetical protein [Pseudomonas aeruginosa]OXZ45982.1 hypothetical protein CIW79_12000 [Pseudomonas aeruginosa]HBO2682603.1 hypothetical protein [Pseudomonas aeruginosa]
MQTARYSELGFFAFVERKSSFILKIIKKNSKEAAIPFHKKADQLPKTDFMARKFRFRANFSKMPMIPARTCHGEAVSGGGCDAVQHAALADLVIVSRS